MKKRNRCSCCGNYTLIGEAEDILWDICPVCYWENDVRGDNIDQYSGANHMTLAEGQKNYQAFGACDINMKQHVRLPRKAELPAQNKDK